MVALVPSPKRPLQIPLMSLHWAHTTSLSNSLPCIGDGSRLNSEKQGYLFSLLLKMKVPLWQNALFFGVGERRWRGRSCSVEQKRTDKWINFIYRFLLPILSLKAHIQVFLLMIQDAKHQQQHNIKFNILLQECFSLLLTKGKVGLIYEAWNIANYKRTSIFFFSFF